MPHRPAAMPKEIQTWAFQAFVSWWIVEVFMKIPVGSWMGAPILGCRNSGIYPSTEGCKADRLRYLMVVLFGSNKNEHDPRPRGRTESRAESRRPDVRRPGATAGHGRIEHQAHLRQGRYAAVAHRRGAARAEDGFRRARAQGRRRAAAAPRADPGAGGGGDRRSQAAADRDLRVQPMDLRADRRDLQLHRRRMRELPGAARQAPHHPAAGDAPLTAPGRQALSLATPPTCAAR